MCFGLLFLEELTELQQAELLNSFSPDLEECIGQLIYCIQAGKIILTGQQDEMNNFQYLAVRSAGERKTLHWVNDFCEDKMQKKVVEVL